MKNKICNISLFSALLVCISGLSAIADSRGNRTYASAYNQANMWQDYDAQLAAATIKPNSATEDLPVAVENSELAEEIKTNKADTTVSELERCSMIYPTGVFKWGVPQSGSKKGGKPQCVAVVNLIHEDTKQILATTTIAAGDSMKCNIGMFPSSGYSAELNNIEIPEDEPPTMKKVEAQLNKEQKENAGIKIVAATLIGGLAGNMLGPKEKGDEKLLGAGKAQLGTTALGAGLAAGLMAASSYSGKVAGDTIKSTAVNATAGMLAGNMAAGLMSSDSVLATTTCKISEGGKSVEKDCIPGRAHIGSAVDKEAVKQLYVTKDSSHTVYKCTKTSNTITCDSDGGYIDIYVNNILIDKMNDVNWDAAESLCRDKEDLSKYHTDVSNCDSDETKRVKIYKVSAAKKSTTSYAAYAVFDKIPHKIFGYKVSDFENNLIKRNPKYYKRKSDNSVGELLDNNDVKQLTFKPSTRSAQDGSVIDLYNESRAKGTMIGAGAGGALGGFSGYQGAQAELTERYLTALRVYDDYVGKFYCATGERFLELYNNFFEIPSAPVLPGDSDTN